LTVLSEQLARITQLAKDGDHEGARTAALEVALEFPNDARAHLAAAYACDRLGIEEEAIHYYRNASTLDIPSEERAKFLLGFGSTLRNAGNTEDAVRTLIGACREFPDRAEFLAFLALAYQQSGQSSLALATMLKAGLMAARDDGFGIYRRALNEYYDELLATIDAPKD
jgi:Flp pilus assembly protein TadD